MVGEGVIGEGVVWGIVRIITESFIKILNLKMLNKILLLLIHVNSCAITIDTSMIYEQQTCDFD